MSETHAHRIKRLKMRSMRRGIKEMDLILSTYADACLDSMDEGGVQLYDSLLDESDPDLYQWITGQKPPPAQFHDLIAEISQILQNKQ